ncbi:cell division protein FtsB [Aeromicrobium panaciterrae]|uniref:Cell division protein FtsB n=1 Tax=Aeromicrobium panaciterrae TaxID=363861 RepID=A0ABU1ULP5_9ACTN|nr:septum formation initiator family protein [Aeromicrobium panaciterrae]MDR7086106.1 cell division protein FtsB [Aeromicrobium panaciterrae]
MATGGPRGPGRKPPKREPSGSSRGRKTTSARASAAAKKPVSSGSGPQLTTRAIVLLSVVLLLVASYTSTLHAWWEQRGDIQSSKAEIVMRKQAIADLEDEKDRWNDPAYVKQQARSRFGWVMPGEVGYRVIGTDGKVRGDVPTLDEPPAATTPQWYDKLWGSVKQSGKTPKAVKTEDPNAVIKKQ